MKKVKRKMHVPRIFVSDVAGEVGKKTPKGKIVLIENMMSRRKACLAAALIVLAALTGGCARRKRVRAPVAPVAGAVEYGIASWYGYPYHGRRTASGEIYDMEKLTAAHRTLPFGAWVEVENLSNSKKVEVRINDRGPFVEGRIIDLSRAAARRIDMIGPGIVRVRLRVLSTPEAQLAPVAFAVQVGAFKDRRKAERLVSSLKGRYPGCQLVRRESAAPPWRVLVGRETNLDAAEALADQLRVELGSAFVVRLDEGVGGDL